jgi:hypothetical protein
MKNADTEWLDLGAALENPDPWMSDRERRLQAMECDPPLERGRTRRYYEPGSEEFTDREAYR